MIACVPGPPDTPAAPVAPELRQYGKPVQVRAAEELEAIELPPCSAQQERGLGDCSALKLMIPNYLGLRDRIRALEEPK